jgi:hypothetical protein
MTRQTTTRTAVAAALSLCLATNGGLIGCSSDAPPARPAVNPHAAYLTHLNATTQAINAGDLRTARAQLDQAASTARSPLHRAQVADLDALLLGAEALMLGDGQSAREAWSNIDDPQLRGQVRDRAATLGLPEATTASR